MKPKFIDAFMDTAERFSQLSSANRLKVGAIIVKDDRIISIGYNGMPAGWTNECEYKVYADAWSIDNNQWDYQEEDGTMYNLKTKPEVIHAEANALSKLAKGTESGKDSTMFLTHAPCIDCAKQIYTTGINSVFYRNSYRDENGIEFLKKCGVEVQKITKLT